MGLYWMKLVDTSLPGFHTLCKDDWVLQWREIVLQHLKLCQTWRGKAFSSRNVKPKVNEQVVVRKLELCQWLDSWTFSFFTVKGRQQLCTGSCWKGLTWARWKGPFPFPLGKCFQSSGPLSQSSPYPWLEGLFTGLPSTMLLLNIYTLFFTYSV